MIDLHSHILPQIDDGSRNIKESAALLKEAKSAGFDAVFATSHYIENSIEESIEKQSFLLKQLEKKLEEDKVDIKLYLGSEIYISPTIDRILSSKKAGTLNNGKYALIELPRNSKVQYLDDVLFRVMCLKYIPIIAHPERYECVQGNPNLLVEFINKGVYFQMNYGSILGIYGKSVKNTAKILLKCNMIHFLGTDVHRMETIYPRVSEAIMSLKKIISEEYLIKLTTSNAQAVIENKSIEITEPSIYKKKLFGIF